MMSAAADRAGPTAGEIAIAIAFLLGAMAFGCDRIGLPPVVIVGGSGIIGLALWLRTYRAGAVDPAVILPPFLLTVAALELHMIEEYVAGFGPAMSRLFAISWTEFSFLMVFAFVGPVLYALTALGLYRRLRIAGFLAWFIFIGPGVAEFVHFVFPLIEPAVDPHTLAPVTRRFANGTLVAAMRNYWIGATGRYYFPGLYTAILPMIPGLYGIRAVLRADRVRRGG